MPSPKRWFPCSRDLNDDPDVWEFTDEFGERALRILLEDELTLSNAWEKEALVEVLVAKGIITKREVLDMLAELRRCNPRGAAPHTELSADPHKIDVIVSHMLKVFNSTGLTAQQAKDVLAPLQVLVEIGERVAHRKATH